MEELYSGFGWQINLETAPLPDGREKKTVRIHYADVVNVIAVRGNGNLVMIRQFRPFFGDYIWELPGGRVNKETDLLEGARRELREEVGLDAQKWRHLYTSALSESLVFAVHLFEARDLIEAPLPADPDELIEVHEMSMDEAIEKVLSSPKVHMASAYGLLRYARENGLQTQISPS